jgi:hypothetical protein
MIYLSLILGLGAWEGVENLYSIVIEREHYLAVKSSLRPIVPTRSALLSCVHIRMSPVV